MIVNHESDGKNENLKLRLGEKTEVFRCPVFNVVRQTARTVVEDPPQELDVFTLQFPDCVCIVPVTHDGMVLLVEQHRFGTDSITLETPGGSCEPKERDTTMAALRELEEETGHTSDRLLGLPGFPMNPATQNSRITFFLAFDVRPLSIEEWTKRHGDSGAFPFERTRVRRVPFGEALGLARTGQVQHVMSALSLFLAEPYLDARFGRKPLAQGESP